MAESFAGRIHFLQSKVCIVLQDMPTDISVRTHTWDSFVILFIYLFIYGL
jgi:2,3-bisphosphoglycerate-independent phosphoglycerate mutase